MKRWIFCGLLLTCTGMFAQEVSYTIEKDEPTDVCNLWVGVDIPIGFDVNNVQDFDFTTAGRVYTDLWNKFNISLNYKRSILSLANTLSLSGVESNTDKLPTFNVLELGGAFYFFSKVKNTRTKVHLYSDGRKSYYIKVPHNGLIMYGLRGGIQRMGSYVSVPSENPLITPTNAYREKYLKYSMTGFYFGIQRSKAVNLKVSTDEYGSNYLNHYKMIAFDILLGSDKIRDKIGNDEANIFVDANGSSVSLEDGLKKAIGYRIVWLVQSAQTNKPIGFYYRMEFGVRPGFENDIAKLSFLGQTGALSRAYFSVSLGLAFKTKLEAFSVK
ncbi:MAG: hypothetical protein N2662_08840 [Bacteroidales bacterium]|nr:hypothetical protein [Bacteroidales bacterium]